MTNRSGLKELTADITALLDLVGDEHRLGAAQAAIQNETLSLAELQEFVPANVIRLANVTADPEDLEAIRATLEDSPELQDFVTALDALKTHFAGLDHHPAVVAELRRELARRSKTREDGENRIAGLSWDPFWADDTNDKLVPGVNVQFRDESENLLLKSRLDWDDLTFLLNALSRILKKHMKRSQFLANEKLLSLPDADSIGERLSSLLVEMQEIQEICGKFGIAVTGPQNDA
ncbi:MAG: hypothetical protein ACLFTT_08060 [Candidatus Hydrogenedentota bacterium]